MSEKPPHCSLDPLIYFESSASEAICLAQNAESDKSLQHDERIYWGFLVLHHTITFWECRTRRADRGRGDDADSFKLVGGCGTIGSGGGRVWGRGSCVGSHEYELVGIVSSVEGVCVVEVLSVYGGVTGLSVEDGGQRVNYGVTRGRHRGGSFVIIVQCSGGLYILGGEFWEDEYSVYRGLCGGGTNIVELLELESGDTEGRRMQVRSVYLWCVAGVEWVTEGGGADVGDGITDIGDVGMGGGVSWGRSHVRVRQHERWGDIWGVGRRCIVGIGRKGGWGMRDNSKGQGKGGVKRWGGGEWEMRWRVSDVGMYCGWIGTITGGVSTEVLMRRDILDTEGLWGCLGVGDLGMSDTKVGGSWDREGEEVVRGQGGGQVRYGKVGWGRDIVRLGKGWKGDRWAYTDRQAHGK
ncbi:hypothetical protein Tco_1457273 [Tanacetum coccineum]